jgi:hypothetical protein
MFYIKFSVSNYTPKLSPENIKNEIQRAFRIWSQYSRLNFLEVYNTNADIVISFGEFDHGDK